MYTDAQVTKFDITGGESVSAGYYTGLNQVINGYLCDLESLFFDRFNLTFEFSFQLSQPCKFNHYLDSLPQPCPIFVHSLSAFDGPSLLVIDNSLANLMLQQVALCNTGQVKLRRDFQVTMENYPLLEETVDDALRLFASSWDRLVACGHTVNKLVSHKIKAKIMSPVEQCVSVRIQATYKGFNSYLEICFSAYQLDKILRSHGSKALLLGDSKPPEHQLDALKHLIEYEACYETSASLGDVVLSKAQLEEALDSGEVIPLRNELQDQVSVAVNGIPLFSAEIGQSLGNQAVQIKGPIEEIRQEQRQKPKPFTKVQYPDS